MTDNSSLLTKAQAGESEAQYLLGLNGLHSIDIPLSESLNWISKAAIQGHSEAACLLSNCYLAGIGVPLDLEQAVAWARKSAASGCLNGKVQLGVSLLQQGNEEEAYTVMQQSRLLAEQLAKKGDAKAMNVLGQIIQYYLADAGDDKRMLAAYQQSAQAGCAQAMTNWANCIADGLTGVANRQEAERQSKEWYEKAAALAEPGALMNLGDAQPATPEGLHQRFILYQKAAQQGNAEALFQLSLALRQGKGCEVDAGQSVHFLQLAAVYGNAQARLNYAHLLRAGKVVSLNLTEAFSMAQKAALQGLEESFYTLGLFYEKGLGTEVSLKEARKWYRLASDCCFLMRGKALEALKRLG